MSNRGFTNGKFVVSKDLMHCLRILRGIPRTRSAVSSLYKYNILQHSAVVDSQGCLLTGNGVKKDPVPVRPFKQLDITEFCGQKERQESKRFLELHFGIFCVVAVAVYPST